MGAGQAVGAVSERIWLRIQNSMRRSRSSPPPCIAGQPGKGVVGQAVVQIKHVYVMSGSSPWGPVS
jgi:hypothetical protein